VIVGLTGMAGSGKDSVADILVRNHGYTRIAFADPLRSMALALNPMVDWGRNHLEISGPVRLRDVVDRDGWDVAKRFYPEVRRTLQRFGTEVIRDHVGPNFWVDTAMAKIVSQPDRNWVITDCRFPNEAEAVVDYGGAVVLVVRPGLEPLPGSHASEAGVGDGLIQARLFNRGTLDDLDLRVAELVEVL
jgi:hypothetical protein